jgi:hypothetical protein
VERLLGTYRLVPEDGATVARRGFNVLEWGLPTVAPEDIYKSRQAIRAWPGMPGVPGEWSSPGILDALWMFQGLYPDDDQYNDDWYPQGITGTADAYATNDGARLLLVAWYFKFRPERDYESGLTKKDDPAFPGARISVIDVSRSWEAPYRHVLLVKPIDGGNDGASFEAVWTHAGGLAWYGDYLYVADGPQLLVFRMDQVTDIKGSNPRYLESTQVGREGSVFHAYGYRYVLPLYKVYTFETDDPTVDIDPFSALGMDKSEVPHRLVAANFVSPGSSTYDSDVRFTVAYRFDFNTYDARLAESAGVVDASDAYRHGVLYVQGVLSAGDRFWFCQSSTENRLVTLETTSSTPESWGWAYGGEGLTYSPTTDNLWCVTEFPFKRYFFCVNRAEFTP